LLLQALSVTMSRLRGQFPVSSVHRVCQGASQRLASLGRLRRDARALYWPIRLITHVSRSERLGSDCCCRRPGSGDQHGGPWSRHAPARFSGQHWRRLRDAPARQVRQNTAPQRRIEHSLLCTSPSVKPAALVEPSPSQHEPR